MKLKIEFTSMYEELKFRNCVHVLRKPFVPEWVTNKFCLYKKNKRGYYKDKERTDREVHIFKLDCYVLH